MIGPLGPVRARSPLPIGERLLARYRGVFFPTVSSFTEDFTTLDTTSKWQLFSAGGAWGLPAAVSGELKLTNISSSNGYTTAYTLNGYSMYNDAFYVKLLQAANANTTGFSTDIFLQSAVGVNDYRLIASLQTNVGGTLSWQFIVRVNGTDVAALSNYALGNYNATNHAWVQFRESGGTFYFEVAPNADGSGATPSATWTTLYSVATASIPFDLYNFLIALDGSNWGTIALTQTITRFDGLNTPANSSSVNTNSNALPATYSYTGAATQDVIAVNSNADPATYAYTGIATSDVKDTPSLAAPATYSYTGAATGDQKDVPSNALPATYSYTGAATLDKRDVPSNALPATYSYSGAATTDNVSGVNNTPSNALPATYSYTGAATQDVIAYTSIALPATFSYTGAATGDVKNTPSAALPAGYSYTGVATTDTVGRAIVSNALPATYSYSGAATSDARGIISLAAPATYLWTPGVVTDISTAIVPQEVFPKPIVTPPLTDAQFEDWLFNPLAIRVVIAETACMDSLGNTRTFNFSSRGFVTKPEDGPNAGYYEPLLRGGIDYAQRINLDLSGDESYGDIELDNSDASLDWMFDNNWLYQPIKAYVGDVTWPRRDFRKIFDGSIADIDSSARDTVNVKLQDKLHRLEMPLHDKKVGGASADADQLLPVAFGECHNVTPVLYDAAKLTYVYHAGVAESVFEVRDNGVPVNRSITAGAPSKFTLLANPAGRITASIQGDIIGSGFGSSIIAPSEGYFNTVPMCIINIVQNWGTESGKRFTDDDIDWVSMAEFLRDNVAPVGLWVSERMTVREACDTIAASVGARVTVTPAGLMQLVKINIPPIGTPIDVGESDMVHGSLHIAARLDLVPSVKLQYCKNWTVQPDTASGLPEEHKAMFAREWFSVSAINEEVRFRYGLWTEPEPENSLLLAKLDATNEATRRLFLSSYQRHVYEFTGFADLIFTQVGQPMRITHHRFGLSMGKTGQVTSVSVNWLTAEVTIQVVI